MNKPSELLLGIPTHFSEIAEDEAFLRPGECQGTQTWQGRLKSLVTFIFGTEQGEGDWLGRRQKRFQVGKSRQRIERHDGVHPPTMPQPQLGFRLTLPFRSTPTLQIHFIVEETDA